MRFWRTLILLTAISGMAAGCGSSESQPAGDNTEQDTANTSIANESITTDDGLNSQQADNNTTASGAPASTRVTFAITAPEYESDALQLVLEWGEKTLNASWVSDEMWTVSDNFPTNTVNMLTITFYDQNGELPLASFQMSYATGIDASESFQVNANQFDTSRWDNDNDGDSNLVELQSGTNPLVNEMTLPEVMEPPSLELVADKTFRFSWAARAGTQFYRVLENPDGVSGYNPVSIDLDASTLSYDHRVPLYLRVNARYVLQSCFSNGCVDSELVNVSGTLDDAVGYIKSSNAEGGTLDFFSGLPRVVGGDRFGSALSLSADGKTLAVGAPGEDSSATGVNGDQADNTEELAGAVYVFSLQNGRWQQQAYIKATNPDGRCCFGGDRQIPNTAISLSADGNVLAVGASPTSWQPVGTKGLVYLFSRNNGVWAQESFVSPGYRTNEDTGPDSDTFGWSVSLDGNGELLLVGDPSNRIVSVFSRSNGVWLEQSNLEPSNPEVASSFGRVVSISRDGSTAAIGAEGERSSSTGINGEQKVNPENTDFSMRNSGAVYVFSAGENEWQQQAFIKANNAATNLRFGNAVALSANGNTLAVGASADRSAATGVNGSQFLTNAGTSVSYSGAVHVYVRNGGNWEQDAYLKASNTMRTAQFGSALSISDDGSTLAIGARGEASVSNGINSDQNAVLPGFNIGQPDPSLYVGAAYVFTRSASDWQQQAYVKATNNEVGIDNLNISFGFALSLSGDGQTLAVASNQEAGGVSGINGNRFDRTAPGAGAVFLY